MKTSLLTIIAVSLLFVSTILAQSQQELILEKSVLPHKGLDEVYRRFSEGYKKLDAALVAELYTETAAYLAPGSSIQTGRQKVLEIFNSFFDSVKKRNGKLEISFRILQRQIDKNLAYDVGIYTLVSTSEKGETRQDRGKFVVVARRENKNGWRFQVDSYSDLPKAQNNQNAQVDSKELETLLDPIFAERMKKLNIPGAVISVVKDGKIIFTKGYGVADIEKSATP
jgi:uncharacterized protein (TIGR02246 family)